MKMNSISRPFPANWSTGFSGNMRIAAGGTEVPFIRNNGWFLRVLEVSTGRHFLYEFATDIFDVEA